jgi:hypothetical protein
MPISIEADPTLAQGYIKVNGTTAATVTSTGLTTASLQNAAVIPAKLSQPYTLATAKAFNWNGSSSNTFLDFESIPSWAKRITVMFSGVSTNGSSQLLVQLGDNGGIETTGYDSGVGLGTTAGAFSSSSAGFLIEPTANLTASTLRYGSMIISLLTGNTWVEQVGAYTSTLVAQTNGGGAKTLSATLDRIRLTTVNGSDTFDAGSVNISYEG